MIRFSLSFHQRQPGCARAIALTILVAGCGSVQTSRGHDQVAALVADHAGAPTRWDAGPPPADRVDAWVRELLAPGLTRQRAIEIALVNNPALNETYEHLGVSQADMVQAGLLRNPTLGIDLGFGHSPFDELRGSIVQDFLDLFVLGHRKDIARAQFTADTLRVAHQALETAAEVSKAVVEVQVGTALVERRAQALETLAADAELTARRFDAGTATELEQAEDKANYEEARLALEHDRLELTERRERLNRWLGLTGPASTWTLRETLAEPALDARETRDLQALALQQRLDVAASAQQAALMQKAVDLARSTRFVGRLEIGVDGHQDPDGPRVIGPNLAIELPLFDQRQATIAKLEAERRETERRHQRLVVDTRSEVRVAEARLETARLELAQYQRTLLPLRRSIVALTLQAYNGMFVGAPRLLAAKRAELDADRGYVDALGAYWIAHAELERAVGRRLDVPAASPLTTAQRTTAP